MNKIVECVPNFSEGRDEAVIKAIADAVRATPGATLLDVDPGKSTNRTVFTFVGDPTRWAMVDKSNFSLATRRPSNNTDVRYRSVNLRIFTLFSIVEAALAAARTASTLIDMRHHLGEHPRLGALDVCPFVPVRGVTVEECVELARQFGARLALELGIPVFLYGAAATEEPATSH